MPLFGGHSRPPLDGLTKDEEKRRDELNPLLTSRTAGKEGAAQVEAVLDVLRERAASDQADFLWPLLLGRQQMSMRHFTDAIDWFNKAVARDEREVRSYCGAASAYMLAGKAAESLGAGVTEAMVPPNMTAEDLYHEADRCYKAAAGLTKDKNELVSIHSAEADVELAIARSVKRH